MSNLLTDHGSPAKIEDIGPKRGGNTINLDDMMYLLRIIGPRAHMVEEVWCKEWGKVIVEMSDRLALLSESDGTIHSMFMKFEVTRRFGPTPTTPLPEEEKETEPINERMERLVEERDRKAIAKENEPILVYNEGKLYVVTEWSNVP